VIAAELVGVVRVDLLCVADNAFDFVDFVDFVSILGVAFVLLLVDTTCLAEDFFMGCLKVFVWVIVEKIVLMTSDWRTLISVTSMISYTLSVLSMISTTLWCLCF